MVSCYISQVFNSDVLICDAPKESMSEGDGIHEGCETFRRNLHIGGEKRSIRLAVFNATLYFRGSASCDLFGSDNVLANRRFPLGPRRVQRVSRSAAKHHWYNGLGLRTIRNCSTNQEV